MSPIYLFIEACAKALSVPESDMRVVFTVSGVHVRCAVYVGRDPSVRYFGAGDDENAAMAVVVEESRKEHATALASEIERLEARRRDAHAAAARAERLRDGKEKELRRSEERAARAAKAFQKALTSDDDAPPALGKGGDDDG